MRSKAESGFQRTFRDPHSQFTHTLIWEKSFKYSYSIWITPHEQESELMWIMATEPQNWREFHLMKLWRHGASPQLLCSHTLEDTWKACRNKHQTWCRFSVVPQPGKVWKLSFRLILKKRLSGDTREMEMDFASEAAVRKTLSKQQLWKQGTWNFKFGSDREFK